MDDVTRWTTTGTGDLTRPLMMDDVIDLHFLLEGDELFLELVAQCD